jgi:hypothetical protein
MTWPALLLQLATALARHASKKSSPSLIRFMWPGRIVAEPDGLDELLIHRLLQLLSRLIAQRLEQLLRRDPGAPAAE